MIAQLTGTVVDIRPAAVVIEVVGVGYLIFVRPSAGFVLGETSTLFTHLAVRENALDLYGFQTVAEREMFELLIKLPKIGPKSALQILSQAELEILVKAISDQDATYLTKLSGIGKKTAEKIVAELKDTPLPGPAHGRAAGAQPTGQDDVIDALVALGYSPKDARDSFAKIPADITETKARITYALKVVTE